MDAPTKTTPMEPVAAKAEEPRAATQPGAVEPMSVDSVNMRGGHEGEGADAGDVCCGLCAAFACFECCKCCCCC